METLLNGWFGGTRGLVKMDHHFFLYQKNGVIFKAARIMADLASEDSSRLLSSFESVLKGRRPPRGWTLGETVGPGRVDQVPLVRKSRGRNL